MTRIIFHALLAAAALASILAPDWSRAQAIYGYYHDLATTLAAPSGTVVAGTRVPLPTTVSNAGPETAMAPRLLLLADPAASLVATEGCSESPAAVLPCRPALFLAPGAKASARFDVRLAPGARGPVVVGITAVADGVDVAPDTGTSMAVLEVVGEVELRITQLARDTFANGQQVVVVRVENRGPSATSALSVPWVATAGGIPVAVTCTAVGDGACAAVNATGRLAPGASLIYSFNFPPLSPRLPTMALEVSAIAADATVTGSDNVLATSWADVISASGFE
jgi:hypothetical protein